MFLPISVWCEGTINIRVSQHATLLVSKIVRETKLLIMQTNFYSFDSRMSERYGLYVILINIEINLH